MCVCVCLFVPFSALLYLNRFSCAVRHTIPAERQNFFASSIWLDCFCVLLRFFRCRRYFGINSFWIRKVRRDVRRYPYSYQITRVCVRERVCLFMRRWWHTKIINENETSFASPSSNSKHNTAHAWPYTILFLFSLLLFFLFPFFFKRRTICYKCVLCCVSVLKHSMCPM